jgi:hypothetical protein
MIHYIDLDLGRDPLCRKSGIEGSQAGENEISKDKCSTKLGWWRWADQSNRSQKPLGTSDLQRRRRGTET